eukprot:11160970-Lingulodinium_polyedra.AAC.1
MERWACHGKRGRSPSPVPSMPSRSSLPLFGQGLTMISVDVCKFYAMLKVRSTKYLATEPVATERGE